MTRDYWLREMAETADSDDAPPTTRPVSTDSGRRRCEVPVSRAWPLVTSTCPLHLSTATSTSARLHTCHWSTTEYDIDWFHLNGSITETMIYFKNCAPYLWSLHISLWWGCSEASEQELFWECLRYVSITTTHVMFSQLLNNFHKENNNNTTQTLSTHHSKQPFMDWVREKCNRPGSRKLWD